MEEKIVEIEKVFNAPIQLVWKAITEKDVMKQWDMILKLKTALNFSSMVKV